MLTGAGVWLVDGSVHQLIDRSIAICSLLRCSLLFFLQSERYAGVAAALINAKAEVFSLILVLDAVLY